MLLPYLWEYKWRVVIALTFLVTAKLANVAVPLVLKEVIDRLTPPATPRPPLPARRDVIRIERYRARFV